MVAMLGLTVGVLSYQGRVFWGLNADYDRVPDLDRFTAMIGTSFEQLAAAAEIRVGGVTPIQVRAAPSAQAPSR